MTDLDLEQLNEILKLVREHDFSEFELEHEGLRLRVKKDGGVPVVAAPVFMPAPVAGVPAVGSAASSSAGGATPLAAGQDEEIELAVVKSPIVGTFYRAPEPGAASFVEVGAKIKKGQVLCVIEAMKLMNEIDAECDGEVVNIYVENGQSVQYGERLFAIRTS